MLSRLDTVELVEDIISLHLEGRLLNAAIIESNL